MASIVYRDSNFRFTENVREFKSNDPYYYEVDNIPIKQLQENCMWLKDQLTSSGGRITGVKRSDIADLQPTVDGATRQLKINTGRFTARVNDSYGVSPMGALRRALENAGSSDAAYQNPPVLTRWFSHAKGDGGANFPPFNGAGAGNPSLEQVLTDLKSYTADRIHNMNGLAERAFGRSTQFPYTGDNSQDGVGQHIGDIIPDVGQNQGFGWFNGTAEVGFDVFGFNDDDSSSYQGRGFNWLPYLENALIRQWRAPARTAVVDVPEPLTIDIPEFDENEFFYTNSEGIETRIENVETRIDLVVLYTKPIDKQISYRLEKENVIRSMTKCEPGLVRGAGVGVDDREGTSAELKNIINGRGEHIMLPDPTDQTATDAQNNGFSNVDQRDEGTVFAAAARGSFPSPDDLLNIAPALVQDLEENDTDLIGQSVLPICYIVTRKGENALYETDLIDIRPFFRTTELTYNERAGICAAYPPLSLANPAVGKRELDRVEQRIREGLLKVEEDVGNLSLEIYETRSYYWPTQQLVWNNITPANIVGSTGGSVEDGVFTTDITTFIHPMHRNPDITITLVKYRLIAEPMSNNDGNGSSKIYIQNVGDESTRRLVGQNENSRPEAQQATMPHSFVFPPDEKEDGALWECSFWSDNTNNQRYTLYIDGYYYEELKTLRLG